MYTVKFDKTRSSFRYLILDTVGNIFATIKTKDAAESYAKLLNEHSPNNA